MAIREGINQVFIEGFLNKKELRQGEKDGRKFIAGTLEIRQDETNIVPVEVFSFDTNKDGKESKIYKGLVTVMNEYKDASEFESWKNADRVRIGQGKFDANDFISQKTNEVATAIKYKTSFINRVDGEFNPKAEFKVEAIIQNLSPEIKNEEETGRGFLDVLLVGYGENAFPVRFVVPEKMFAKMDGEVEKGSTMLLWGKIVSTIETNTITEEAEYGENNERVITNSRRERVLIGAKYIEDEKVFSKKDIKQLLEKRQNKLEELKTDKKFNSMVSGGKPQSFNDEDDDDDFPF